MRYRAHIKVALAAALVTSMPLAVQAQMAAPATVAPATVSPAIDPNAAAALNRMAAYLQSLKAFQVKAELTKEEVLEDGQKVQFAAVADMVAERPGKLRVDVNSDRQQRLFLFDGETFTVYAPKMKYYAQVPAPKTIGELVDTIESKYELELPLVDFFRWNTSESMLGNITAARDLGPSQIGGVTTQHYAIRQDGLDWQIWIQNGDFPLPRKVVLTTTTDEARPQYTAVYTWNLAPSFNAASFAFTAPADAKKISLGEVPTELELREPR
jgi:hypothetical protein